MNTTSDDTPGTSSSLCHKNLQTEPTTSLFTGNKCSTTTASRTTRSLPAARPRHSMSHRGRRRGQQQTGSRRRSALEGRWAIGVEARVTSETSPTRCPSCSRASISSSCPPASSLWSSLSRPLSSFLLPIVVAVAETEAGSVVRAAEQNNGGRRRGEGKSRRRKQELNPVLTR